MPTLLITGASSGIGKAIVQYFQRQGWNVAATMRRPADAQDLENLPNVRCLRLDVGDTPSIEQAIKDTIACFGGLDVLVNNAGYGTVGAFEASTEAQIHQQFDTNLFGLMRVTRAILPYFRGQQRGLIINISSVGGRVTFPLYSIYHSTKWAVEGFTESLQYELSPLGIGVKLIEPGAIKTDFYSRSQVAFHLDGFTVYDDYQRRVLFNISQTEAQAPPPGIVARVVFRAATDRSSRLRYSVGDQTPLLLFIRRLLPHSWFRSIIRRILEQPSSK